jgi:hypothetical protein
MMHRPRPEALTDRKRLLSLSTQKFISDLSRDAFHFAKLRVNGATQGRGRPAAAVSPLGTTMRLGVEVRLIKQDRNRVVLTMDDLSLALGEHGVNVKKPDYCACCFAFGLLHVADNHRLIRRRSHPAKSYPGVLVQRPRTWGHSFIRQDPLGLG